MFAVKTAGDVTCLRMSRTLFGSTIRVAYCFVVDGLCVDTGPSNLKRPFAAYMRDNPPRQAFLTHSHEDHAGNADVLNGLGVFPLLHRGGLQVLENPPHIPLYRRLVWGRPAPARGRPVGEGSTLDTDRYSFEIIPSSGHSQDHICLHEKRRGWLFSGDGFLGERVLYLHAAEDVTDLMSTLERLSSLDFEAIFCGHRGMVNKGPRAFREKLAYLQGLQEEALQLEGKGWGPRAITRRLLGREDIMNFISGGEFSKILLIRGLLKAGKKP